MILDPKTSQRIFALAKDQQQELEDENENDEDDEQTSRRAALFKPRLTGNDEDEDDMGGESGDEILEEEEYPELVCFLSIIATIISDLFILQQIDAGDLETLDTLLPPSANERKTLADMIFAKLEAGDNHDSSVSKIQKGMTMFPVALSRMQSCQSY